MDIGLMKRALGFGLLFSVAALACSGSDDSTPQTPGCGTQQAPTALEIKDVSPALDASVKNSSIVQTFTVAGHALKFTPNLAAPAAHTAGLPTPNPTKWTLSLNGSDAVYTSEPIAWSNAPGHVELDSLNLLKADDGCFYALPQQMFKYDVTAP
ncbi:MAG TPA: hypothetical protein VER96_22375 [Polyangiaceae bacterium]|nr:hypothetical protein [Polyangiaceae bacterium]